MTIQPINSGLTVQRIYQYFCDSIISEDLKPGDMLPSEGQLAEAFNAVEPFAKQKKCLRRLAYLKSGEVREHL